MCEIRRVIAAFERIRQREEKQLQRLLEDDTNREMLRALTDRFVSCLTYLANYTIAIDGRGRQWPMSHIHSELQSLMGKELEKLTKNLEEEKQCHE